MNQVNVEATAYKLNGDLRALALVYDSDVPLSPSEELVSTIDALLTKTKLARKKISEAETPGEEYVFCRPIYKLNLLGILCIKQ